ncbi:uncharacterized protein DNG_10318 [Cephalotrichum gorgonifer]|uniref:Uncharacterized protein n=1 Tax=Cephalotrichum gorgonifer TaxID=2041049 RepID=A0AAE8N8S6_9PEZI|nr:uncharacterized protein DNG_10318 [Cephalotrichum gorgonifer]
MVVSWDLDVNEAIVDGLAALHAACSRGNIRAVEWLLNKGAHVNSLQDRCHRTPLSYAVESKEDAGQKVILLLDKGAAINFKTKGQPTALWSAAAQKKEDIIKLRLKRGANANLDSGGLDTALNTAIMSGVSFGTISAMLAHGADISKAGFEGKLPIHAAAVRRLDVLELLANEGADLLSMDDRGRSTLTYAMFSGFDSPTVSYLLCNTPFDKLRDMSRVEYMAQMPLIIANAFYTEASVDGLLQSGFVGTKILNAQNYQGKTALAIAASQSRHPDVVERLLKSGADPAIVDCRGRGPLFWAAGRDWAQRLDILIEALEKYGSGADGWTPLYSAGLYRFPDMESILREAGATSDAPQLKLPISWHPEDKHPGLELESNGTTLRTVDFPMFPLFVDNIYYFEVKIVKAGSMGCIIVGFCQDTAQLGNTIDVSQQGWEISAVFPGDDGKSDDFKYEEKQRRRKTKREEEEKGTADDSDSYSGSDWDSN